MTDQLKLPTDMDERSNDALIKGPETALAAERAKAAANAAATAQSAEAAPVRRDLPTTQWGKPAPDDGAGVGLIGGVLNPPPKKPDAKT